MKTAEELIAALPPEDRRRLEKKAAAEKKDARELVIKILAEGANTPAIVMALANASAPFIFAAGC